MKTALTIAGSDASGGAGIQADLKTFSAHGVFGMSVIVSVVAENTRRVIAIGDISPILVEQQIDSVFEDMPVDGVKIGMLSSSPLMEAVAGKLRQYKPSRTVLDPVMVAKNGSPLMQLEAVHTLIKEVLPLAYMVTPNIPEAEIIAGMSIKSHDDMEAAAKKIHALGPEKVLIKGGHAVGDAVDILFDGNAFHRFSAPRVNTKNTHGTGCTFSSAITSNLALGLPVNQAVARAKKYITGAILNALPLGGGHGPTHHFYALYREGLEKALNELD